MKKSLFTYKKSGVNINAADKFVNFIANISPKKRGNKKFNNIGGFGSISNIPKHIKQPKIVACTDGVGTKIEIANTLDKFDTIGIDLVAMSVNDLIVQGAKPLLFLDYISINKLDLNKLKSIILRISLSFASSIFLKSDDLTSVLTNSEKAFLNPMSITLFLLKLFWNGFEISTLLTSKDLAFTLVVEKKNIFRARMKKRIYNLLK